MSDMRWQLVAGVDPISHTWGEEAVVFERFSGDTHLLDIISLRIIDLLAQGAMSEPVLMEKLGEDISISMDDGNISHIKSRLRALVQLNLVEGSVR